MFSKCQFLLGQHPTSVPEFFTQDIENPSHEIHTYNPPLVHQRHFKKDTLGKVIDRIERSGGNTGWGAVMGIEINGTKSGSDLPRTRLNPMARSPTKIGTNKAIPCHLIPIRHSTILYNRLRKPIRPPMIPVTSKSTTFGSQDPINKIWTAGIRDCRTMTNNNPSRRNIIAKNDIRG